ncbi:MAG: DNA polymerase III subunit chi [Magnetococcales bacterium]|nr:DNA polymerase III subunit chi [Magnetococcales bacterium]
MARDKKDSPTTVRFYQLGKSTLEVAITTILNKAWAKGIRSTLLTPGDEPSRYWDNQLWYSPTDAFLPHGTQSDPDPELQPLLIASKPTDQNGATLIVLSTPQLIEKPEQFDMVVDFVDGSSPNALNASRVRYKKYMDLGCNMEYWIQGEDNKWSLKDSTANKKK